MSNSLQRDMWPVPEVTITNPVILEVSGSVPSFKNNKMILTHTPRGRPLNRPLLITKPEFQKRMKEIEESFVFQLLSAFRTEEGQTLTGRSLRCAIALSVPEDDCWTQIREIEIKGELCDKGKEGATITITRME